MFYSDFRDSRSLSHLISLFSSIGFIDFGHLLRSQGRMAILTQEQEMLKRNAVTLIIYCSNFELDALESADNNVSLIL